MKRGIFPRIKIRRIFDAGYYKTANSRASNEQIATAKLLYQDLEKWYDLGLFIKPDHIRIYVGHWSWLGIAKNGRIGLHLDKFQGEKND